MPRYRYGCTPSLIHPGFCADCGERLVLIPERSVLMSTPGMFHEPILLIPDYDDPDGPVAPGNPPIPSGYYTLPELVELLRTYKEQPEAIQFIADMLEE